MKSVLQIESRIWRVQQANDAIMVKKVAQDFRQRSLMLVINSPVKKDHVVEQRAERPACVQVGYKIDAETRLILRRKLSESLERSKG